MMPFYLHYIQRILLELFFCCWFQNNRVHAPLQPPVFRCGGKASRHKLDSRFIQDVNILDGTIMAPSTSFTKIWKMRNNGSVVWPQGTQLVWIGGDKLSDIFSVDTEVGNDLTFSPSVQYSC